MPPETPEQIYAQNLEEGVMSTDPSSPIGIQPSSGNTAVSLRICREKTISTWYLLVGLCMCECSCVCALICISVYVCMHSSVCKGRAQRSKSGVLIMPSP